MSNLLPKMSMLAYMDIDHDRKLALLSNHPSLRSRTLYTEVPMPLELPLRRAESIVLHRQRSALLSSQFGVRETPFVIWFQASSTSSLGSPT